MNTGFCFLLFYANLTHNCFQISACGYLTSSGSEQMGTELSGTVSSVKLKAYVSRCWSIYFTHVMGFLYCRFHERGS